MKKLGFLLDMDGVIYKNNELINGAKEFVAYLQKNEIPFLFLTNNSRPTPKDISLKLKNMGLKVPEKNIYTSAMATAQFLAKQKPDASCYIIGEGGIFTALHDHNLAIVDSGVADFVVVGEGRTLSSEAVEKAINMLLQGAKLIATNLDPSPKDLNWIKPGTKAITTMLCEAAGVECFSLGKPSPIMMRYARKAMDLATDSVVMVGDTMSTDILSGVCMGYKSVLVLTGSSKKEDLKNYAYRPYLILDHIGQLIDILKENKL